MKRFMKRFDRTDPFYQVLIKMFPAFSNLIPIDLNDIDEDHFETGISSNKYVDWEKKRLVLSCCAPDLKDQELEPYVGSLVIDIKNWTSLTIIKEEIKEEKSIIHFNQVNFDERDYMDKYFKKDEKVMTNQEINFIESVWGVIYTPDHVILKSWGVRCDLLWVFSRAEFHCYVELESTPQSPRLAHLAQKVFNDPELNSFFPPWKDPLIEIDIKEVDTHPFLKIGGYHRVDWVHKRIVFNCSGVWLKNKELSQFIGNTVLLDIKNWSELKMVMTRKSIYDVEGDRWTFEDMGIIKEEEVVTEDQIDSMKVPEVFTYDQDRLILSHRVRGENGHLTPTSLHWVFSRPEVNVYATLKEESSENS